MRQVYRVPVKGRITSREGRRGTGDPNNRVGVSRIIDQAFEGEEVEGHVLSYDWDNATCLVEIEGSEAFHGRLKALLPNGEDLNRMTEADKGVVRTATGEAIFIDDSVR